RPRQIRRLRQTLRTHGVRIVALARFAIFPTGLLAATAGASGMDAGEFFSADGLALLVATGVTLGAGYLLGVAAHSGKAWLLAVGVAGLVALAGSMTWYVARPRGDDETSKKSEQSG